jgi:hypothetical protein
MGSKTKNARWAGKLLLVGLPLLTALYLLSAETIFSQRQSRLIAAAGAAELPESRLRLGFADRSGLYLANVMVAVVDTHGSSIANLLVDGPWLDLKLLPGTYQVTATFRGKANKLDNLKLEGGCLVNHVLFWDLNVVPPDLMVQRQKSNTA